MMAINSFLFRRPHILFEDTEHSQFCLLVCRLLSDVIITPVSFRKNLGRKQLRIPIYKELFYLHPHVYHPDPGSLDPLHLTPGDPYIIIRFIAWDAHHDIGQYGITDKYNFIKELEKFGRIFVSSESDLPEILTPYQLQIPSEKFHDILSYAAMHIGEGATVAVESAILGTPSLYISSLAGSMGNLIDLEERYHLLSSFRDTRAALDKATELLERGSLKQEWSNNRARLLEDTIDPTRFFLWFLEVYPDSPSQVKEHPEILERFR